MKGFSLIELMVSLTIGLIIAVAAMSAYMGASGASRVAAAQGRMYEDAQAALIILTQQLRMAGNNPDQANRTAGSLRNPVYSPLGPANFIIRGCDGNFIDGPNLDNLNCVAGPTGSIAVNYEADIFNTIPTSTTPTAPSDCVGNRLGSISATVPTVITTTIPFSTVTSTVNYSVAVNQFYIGSSNNIPSLFCRGNGGSGNEPPQALVENIEDMQFSYGTMPLPTVPASTATAQVAGYQTATQLALLTPATDAIRWGAVLTVRLCVLVRSERPVVSDAASARYLTCNGNPDNTQTDLRLRRAFYTTVVLRNRQI